MKDVQHQLYGSIYFLPFSETRSCEHIKCLVYEAAIQTFENVFYWLSLIDSFTIWKQSLKTKRSILQTYATFCRKGEEELVLENIFNVQVIRQPPRLSRIYLNGFLFQINSRFGSSHERQGEVFFKPSKHFAGVRIGHFQVKFR